MVTIPTEPNLGPHLVLDIDQLRIIPRLREIYNQDLTNEGSGPDAKGDQVMGGWRFTWCGVKNNDIAVEKEQIRKKGDKIYINHWDHVMTYPPACEHAMQVM